jgi:hypothetical protein
MSKYTSLIITLIILVLVFFKGSEPAFADSFYPNAGVDSTDQADTVPHRHPQWLFNAEWDESRGAPFAGSASIAYKYGLSENMDFGIQFPYIISTDQNFVPTGLTDLGAGVKYRWTPDRDEIAALSTAVGIKPSVCDVGRGLSNGTTDISVHMGFSYAPRKIGHHLNYGWTLPGGIPDLPRNPSNYYKYQIAYECSEKCAIAWEVYGETTPNPDLFGDTLQTTVKTSLAIGKNLTLDLGVAFGLNNNSPPHRYLIGLTLDQ